MSEFTRRQALGLGAGVVGAGLAGAGVDAIPLAAGTTPSTGAVPQATLLPPPQGTRSMWLGPDEFRARGLSQTVEHPTTFTVAATSALSEVFAYMPLEAGSRLRRVEVVSRMESTAAGQNVGVVARNVATNSDATLAVVALLAPAVTGFVTAVLDLDVVFDPNTMYRVVVLPTKLNSPGFSHVSGAKVHYEPVQPRFVPVTPFRVFDSRWAGFGGRFTGGTNRVISVANARSTEGLVVTPNAVPAQAKAITFNVTVTGANGLGLLSVTPGSATTFTTATINWSGTGIVLANASTVALSGDRQIKVFCAGNGASTDAVVDVTGYFV